MRYLFTLMGFLGIMMLNSMQAQVKVPFILQENRCVVNKTFKLTNL